jgi:hypothetical protein
MPFVDAHLLVMFLMVGMPSMDFFLIFDVALSAVSIVDVH